MVVDEKFEDAFKRNEMLFHVVDLEVDLVVRIHRFAKLLVEKKKGERHHAQDNRSEMKRFTTGLLGEAAIETFLGVEIIDWTIGDSELYHKPDLQRLGIQCGIKTVEFGRFPIVFKKSYGPEIINVKIDNSTVAICGLATAEVLNRYQDDGLILDLRLRSRGTKTGFYGFDHLLHFENLEGLKKLV